MSTDFPSKNSRKQTWILFELLIALSLSAVLLSALFSFLVQSSKIEKKWETARNQAMQRAYLNVRLQNVFASIDRLSKAPSFYTEKKEKDPLRIIFRFDNGIDPDPDFSGIIQGEIFLDADRRLQLKIAPLSDEEEVPSRIETLYSQVKQASFEYLGPPDKDEKPISESLCWRKSWPQSLQKAPGMIRLYLHEEGEKEPIRYAFLLPTVEGWVSYRGSS